LALLVKIKNLLHRIATPEVHHNPSLLEASPGFVMGQCYGDSQRVSSNCNGHMWSRLRSLSALPKQQRKRQNDEEQLRTDEEARISRSFQKVDKSDSMPEGTFFNEPAGGRFPGGREVVIELELLSKRGWLVF
jgi:hypothetical protein